MTNSDIDHSKKWLVMAAVGMGMFLGTIDSSIVNVALPTMVRYFKTDFATIQWVVLAYLLTATTLILTVGRLADMKGKKPIYALGFVLFTIGSFLCGLAPSVKLLILARVFQGIGATMTTALGMAIITEAFPASERGRALGIGALIVSGGIVLGPTLGGVILQYFQWQWIFFINIPIGIIGTFMVLRFVPNFKPVGDQKFDFLGAISLVVCLLSFLLALTWGQRDGFGSLNILILFSMAVIFLILFIVTELRMSHPMIDLRLFKNKIFTINLITRLMTFIAIAGATILMPFYLEGVLQYSPQKIGLMMAVFPISMGLIAPLSGYLSDKMGTERIMVVGMLILLIGYSLVSTLSEETSTMGYLLRFIPVGMGMGIFQSPNNSAVMGATPRNRLGIASGILSVVRTLGQTSGIAILGAFWASRTFAYAGKIFPAGATSAPAFAQVSGLQSTFSAIAIMLTIGLGLNIWGMLLKQKESRQTQTLVQTSSNTRNSSNLD